MKIRLLGASLAALALGIAACAKDETKYAEDDTATTTDSTTTVADDTTTTTTTTTTTAANDPYATPSTTATTPSSDPFATAPTTGAMTADAQPTGSADSAQYGVTTAGEVFEIAEINNKADAERIASDAFDKADANGDGQLDRSEYVMIAMGANEFVAGSSPIDVTPEGVGEGDIDTGDTLDSTAPADTTTPTVADTTDAVNETTVATVFTEAAGTDNTLTKEELRAAFLARFDKADADNNGTLTEEERQTFAQLTTGDTTP